jgi:DNA-binding NtrC family response regulator
MERMRAGASPRLLLLDMAEGDADCMDMLRWMRRIRPALPVIMIACSSDTTRQEESMRLGAKAYLSRPLDEGLFAHAIESSLRAEVEAHEDIEAENTRIVAPRNDSPSHSPSQREVTDPEVKSLRSLLKSVRTEAERNAIARALEQTGGNRKAAARLLKVSYRTVLYKIEEYKMIPPAATVHPKSDGAWDTACRVREDMGSARPGQKPLKDRRKELQ